MQTKMFLLGSLMLAIGLVVPEPVDASDNVRIEAGSEHEGDVETRNGRIEIGDEAAVDGHVKNRNGSINIADSVSAGDVSTRNGSIRLGQGGRFGEVSTRNGRIEIGPDNEVGEIRSRNGSVAIGEGTRVDGEVRTRNGSIDAGQDIRVDGSASSRNGTVRFDAGSEISGEVTTRNGNIDLTGTSVGQGAGTIFGNIVLRDGSRINDDVIVEIEEEHAGRSGWLWFGGGNTWSEAGDIRILEGSEVGGDIRLVLPAEYDNRIPVVEIDADSSVSGSLYIDSRVELIVEGTVGGRIERIEP